MRRTCLGSHGRFAHRGTLALVPGPEQLHPDEDRLGDLVSWMSHGRCTRAGPPVGTPLVEPGLEAALSGLTFRQPSAASVPGLVHAILGVRAQLPTRGGAESHGRMDQAMEKVTPTRLSFG